MEAEFLGHYINTLSGGATLQIVFQNVLEVKLLPEASGGTVSEQLPSAPVYVRSDAQSCLTLCNPADCNLLGSSVHGISQARILEWVAISFSRGSS